jgi:ankyrin repeat protein
MELLRAAGGVLGLREAVILGDVKLARRLCDRDQSIDVSGDARLCFDDTYLMVAARLGDLDMVNFLVDRGANIEGSNDVGHTALMSAAESGNAIVVQRLLELGSDVNTGWPVETAISLAEANGNDRVASLLQRHGAKRRLRDAVDRDDAQLADELLRGGTDPEGEIFPVRAASDQFDEQEFRLVRVAMYAVSRGNREIVRLLLDHGASFQIKFHDEHTLLAEAARCGRVDVARLLIERGADVHAVGTDGLNALEWASRGGHVALTTLLRQACADVGEQHG